MREPLTRETHERWLTEKIATGLAEQFIILDEAGRGIGCVYLRDINRETREAELGIFIGEASALGKGYGQEAVEAITEYGFTELMLKLIYLRVLKTNERAIRVYRRAGFSELSEAREDAEVGNEDVVWMAKAREDGIL